MMDRDGTPVLMDFGSVAAAERLVRGERRDKRDERDESIEETQRGMGLRWDRSVDKRKKE